MDRIMVPSTQAADAPRTIQSLALPHFGEAAPGPLHTVVTDSDGNVYYSDEFNHSVVCVSGNGSVRWQRTQHGAAAREFRYPRGLSLGFLQLGGERIRCLAIADAWNRRVQFVDYDGNALATWTHGGEKPFGEVADVRFIAESMNSNGGEEPAAFWYVLDRGNHRICKLGIDGKLIYQIGQAFPRNMENRWAAPELFFNRASGKSQIPDQFPPLDFIFYPNRILGNAIDSIFVCESNSRRLKHVLPPHLLPVEVDSDGNPEWIAADSFNLLAWDPVNRCLIRRRGPADEDRATIAGVPIPSNLPLNEFWAQTEDGLARWEWPFAGERKACVRPQVCPWTMRSAAKKISRLDLSAVQKSVEVCLAHLDEEIRLADTILAMDEKDLYPQFMDGMSGHAHEFTVKCTWFSQRVRESLHHWCAGQLELQIAGIPEDTHIEKLADYSQPKNSLIQQISSRIADIRKRVDDLGARLSSLSAAGGKDLSSTDSWTIVARIAKSNLEFAIGWIVEWSGINGEEQ